MRSHSKRAHRAEKDPEYALVETNASTVSAPECFYPQYQGLKKEGRTAMARNLTVKHSVFKLAVVGRLIRGKHLYDAQALCNTLPTKAAETMKKILNSARNNANQLGMDEQ